MSRVPTAGTVLIGYFAASLLVPVTWGLFCAGRDLDFPGLVPAMLAWWRRVRQCHVDDQPRCTLTAGRLEGLAMRSGTVSPARTANRIECSRARVQQLLIIRH